MTILRGHFAILLVLSRSEKTSEADLERALAPVEKEFGLTVGVRTIDETGETTDPVTGAKGAQVEAREGEPWTVVVQGADHPGIVSSVTAALSATGGNIVDLATHLVGKPDDPVYVMTFRALLPSEEADVSAQRVRQAASEVGVHCTITRDDADIL